MQDRPPKLETSFSEVFMDYDSMVYRYMYCASQFFIVTRTCCVVLCCDESRRWRCCGRCCNGTQRIASPLRLHWSIRSSQSCMTLPMSLLHLPCKLLFEIGDFTSSLPSMLLHSRLYGDTCTADSNFILRKPIYRFLNFKQCSCVMW